VEIKKSLLNAEFSQCISLCARAYLCTCLKRLGQKSIPLGVLEPKAKPKLMPKPKPEPTQRVYVQIIHYSPAQFTRKTAGRQNPGKPPPTAHHNDWQSEVCNTTKIDRKVTQKLKTNWLINNDQTNKATTKKRRRTARARF